MSHVKKAHKVGVYNVLILLFCYINPVAVVGDTSVVHKNIYVVTKLVYRCFYQSFAILVLAHISFYNKSLCIVLFFNLCCDVVRKSFRRLASVVDNYIVTKFSQLK